MAWVSVIAGFILVVLVTVDIFHTVFHPRGQGRLSTAVMRLVWNALPSRLAFVGPLALIAVMVVWTVLACWGWALIYLPWMPDGFYYSSGLDVSARSNLLDAVYASSVMFATLGFGDIVPTLGWLRIAAPLEALMGFAVLTASVSWVLQIYPALTRRRALVQRLSLLHEARDAAETVAIDSSAVASLLTSLAGDIGSMHVDFTQHAETYYFRDGKDADVTVAFDHALGLAEAGRRSDREDTRFGAEMLDAALHKLAAALQAHQGDEDATATASIRQFAQRHNSPA